MAIREFTGFAGVPLIAETYGQEDHPCVVMIPGGTQTRGVWDEAAASLAAAGRYVICPDLRGHGDSGRPTDGNYKLDVFIADLVAMLAQLSSRPVLVGSTLGGWIALTALGEATAPLATGLVLTNPLPQLRKDNAASLAELLSEQVSANPNDGRFDKNVLEGGFDFVDLENRLKTAAPRITIPTLIVRGTGSELATPQSTERLAQLIPDVAVAEIEGGGHYVAFDNADDFNAALLAFLEQHAPREAPEYISGSDPRTLRDAMGCFATGITIVTTTDVSGQPVGLTANSFSSVSLDPPLVLACLGKKVGSMAAFEAASSFAINVLHMGQQPLSNLFASKGVDRFANTDWEAWDLNVPIIKSSLASFECRKTNQIEQGDHTIFVGEVVRAKFEPRRDPLLYFSGKYRRLHFN